jgi:hypothetical protein
LYKIRVSACGRGKICLKSCGISARELSKSGRSGSLGGGVGQCSGRCAALSVCNPDLPADPSLEARIQKILVQNYLMFYWVDEEKKAGDSGSCSVCETGLCRLLE